MAGVTTGRSPPYCGPLATDSAASGVRILRSGSFPAHRLPTRLRALRRRPPDPAAAGREEPVKAGAGTVKEPSRPPLTCAIAAYEGRMTDVVYLLLTVLVFAGLALLVGALDRPEKDRP